MKIWKIVFYTLGLIPLTLIIPLLTFYFHTAHLVGHLPTYGNPDPKDTGLYSFYSPMINLGFTFWFIGFLIWLLMLIIYAYVKQKKQISGLRKPILLGAFLNLSILFLFFSTITEWYAD
jgi:hypothetical protein